MRVLAINCGSSTLKFQLIEMDQDIGEVGQERKLAEGTIDRIGGNSILEFSSEEREEFRNYARVTDHGEALSRGLNWLDSTASLQLNKLGAVGHRVVHGGSLFTQPTLINDEVMDAIEGLRHLAPLHNEPSLIAMRTTLKTLGPSVPMVAVFDTAFHSTMPDRSSQYAIPRELAEKHQIRRYGFHGIAHRYMTERYTAITSTPLEETKLITLQLGNGCSAAAVEGGLSVDTSMGLTPLEGLVMGTRSGDVDPSLIAYLARQEGVSAEEAEGWLNKRSGLLGLSGRSHDMRELLEGELLGDTKAGLAIDMFCYRVRKYIGSYMTVLGGADSIVFGGGIGENSPSIRARICERLDWTGLQLDPNKNDIAIGIEGRISTDKSKVHAYVIPVDEEVIIARDTVDCLHRIQE